MKNVINYILIILVFVVIGLLIWFMPDMATCDCKTDNKHFVKTGIIVDVNFYGYFNMIDFENGDILCLHGSPNEKIDLCKLKNYLSIGSNYTFYYHHECVWDDGNEPTCIESNVIDRIEIN